MIGPAPAVLLFLLFLPLVVAGLQAHATATLRVTSPEGCVAGRTKWRGAW